MSTRTSPLGPDDLAAMPDSCRRCVFWELGAARPAAIDDASTPDHDRIRKQAWVTARTLESGPPGVLVRVGRRTVGYALYAPSGTFAARPMWPTASPDALLLATVWLEPGARAAGVGRQLVQAAVRDAIHRGLGGVEAYGDRRSRENDCVLPVTWLLHEGFEVHVEHPRYPLLRIDARRAVRWAESLEHAVEGFLGRVTRPSPAPATSPSRQALRSTTAE